MSHPNIGNNAVDRIIFREYIGVKPYPKPFKSPAIDNNKINEFHVILGFAHEIYNEDGKGTGDFYIGWDLDNSGVQSVKDIKQKYPHVKVIISIGGRDIDHHTNKYPFSPIEKEYWCDKAFASLKKIIEQNKFDGIDINYEHIITNDEKDFANYIENVIFRLKKEVGIDVVSIAPSHENDKYYKLLYSARTNDINWVNYQFYLQPIPTEAAFISIFERISVAYPVEKLLVGASTDPRDAGKFSLDIFRKSCTNLIKRKSLSGIFIWNANDLEKIALDIISNN